MDNDRRWYRYHHLFADLLRQRLHQNSALSGTGEEGLAEFHRRASAWYAANGFPAEAIHHAFAAKDDLQAASLLELAWPEMDERFQAAVWLGWAKALPDEIVRTRPVLSVAYAWTFLNGGELEAAETRLQDAEKWQQDLNSLR